MYGTTPPARRANVYTQRVPYVLISVLSCGFLSAVTLFRVAILRGRWYDWALAWGGVALVIGLFATIGSLPETDPRTDAAAGLLILTGVAAAVHFLVFDIRRGRDPRYPHPHPPYATHPQPAPYPQSQPPYTQGPTRPVAPQQRPASYGYPQQQTPAPTDRPPYTAPRPPAHAQGGGHQRIDQVRAELDELSDLLRGDDSGGGGSYGTPPRDPRTGPGDSPR
ncbi:hypothetical protein [Streptomyces sp. NPDC060194]|uniref:hypothetical protein n=1 Tax=Streptomyces sp. NPDC060194 TaxID=3347069 RepID=UPI0036499D25